MITCDLMVLRRVELALRSGPMESALERSYTDGLKRGRERERERERDPEHARHAAAIRRSVAT